MKIKDLPADIQWYIYYFCIPSNLPKGFKKNLKKHLYNKHSGKIRLTYKMSDHFKTFLSPTYKASTVCDVSSKTILNNKILKQFDKFIKKFKEIYPKTNLPQFSLLVSQFNYYNQSYKTFTYDPIKINKNTNIFTNIGMHLNWFILNDNKNKNEIIL